MTNDELRVKQEAREDAMSFLDFLKAKLEEVERISHKDKSDSVYYNCRNIISRIQHRIKKEGEVRNLRGSMLSESHHSQLTSEELDGYKSSFSDKRKREMIGDFRRNLLEDLTAMISDREPPTIPAATD